MVVWAEVSLLCPGELHDGLAGEVSVMLCVYHLQGTFRSIRMKGSGEMLNSSISVK